MHGLPLELIEQQAESLDLSLEPIFLKPNIPLEEYNLMMNQHLDKFKKQGFTHSVFGDILLADLKKYRETQLRSEEHTSELQSRGHLVCRLLLEKKKKSNRLL